MTLPAQSMTHVPIHMKGMARVPNHPYASYRAGPDRMGQWWIEAQCSKCHDRWRHQCVDPSRTNSWVYRYAVIHAHGLMPVHQNAR